ncbi:Aspartyl/glutamyl-tRNA(Asn/Gln) amidotransferase subunit [Heracleum sosnowskyi]|uniref:Aspartyl/glutamyl-tRNA(Asn/Gln) amidotransferase subunit n=1 Tax=Heracleum sosnowskyi TaxID=360622 RepID=A0AAD8IPV7_9APIA|nr:Aspartyl/glutamyl-tRNA(Asn/Gln) amidotransferase subunit [Heracleum sosnowskyi]
MFSSWPDFLALFYRSTMGCLLGCFGLRDASSRPSSPLVSQSNTPVFSRNRKRLSSLPLPQEGSQGSPGNEKQSDVLDSPHRDLHFEGLRDEAMFLKACGTLLETPAEIRKASIKLNGSSPTKDSEYPEFHSWLPNTSVQKLNLEMEPDQAPTPKKQCENWVSSSGSSAHEPNSCLETGPMISVSAEDSDAGKFGMAAHNYASQTASVQSRNKSVRFTCPSDTSLPSSKSPSSEAYSQRTEQSESWSDERASKLSPNPTPLQLTDDMQTPGTVFPSYIGNMIVGKNPRIRTQYVQSLANSTENFPHLRVWIQEESSPDQESGHLIKSFEQADSATPDPEVRVFINSAEEEMKVEENFSSCMKPQPANQCVNDQRVVTFASDNTYFGNTPGDRPVLGTVAIHWNEDESSLISPKWWDANGIPNSTTKYKEDQKVSWHATPFEERLEKVLSQKHIISQRRNLDGTPPLDFNGNKELDTAVSPRESTIPVDVL